MNLKERFQKAYEETKAIEKNNETVIVKERNVVEEFRKENPGKELPIFYDLLLYPYDVQHKLYVAANESAVDKLLRAQSNM